MVVAGIRHMIAFELMLPLDNRLCIGYPQIPYVIVKQINMSAILSHPADQFGLFEICYVLLSYLNIHFFGAPFYMSLYVNQT